MKYAVFLVFFILVGQATRAQESMSKDVSYAYLDKLIATCKANYPKIKSYDMRVKTAEIGVKRAKLSIFEIFSAGYLYSPNSSSGTAGTASFLGGYQLGFFANVGAILQKPSAIKQARNEFSVAQYDKEAFEMNMEAEVKKRYFIYIQRVAALRIISGALLDVESMLITVKHRFEKGEVSIENYNQALLAYSDHSQNIVSGESEVLIAKSNLEELLGQKLEDIK